MKNKFLMVILVLTLILLPSCKAMKELKEGDKVVKNVFTELLIKSEKDQKTFLSSNLSKNSNTNEIISSLMINLKSNKEEFGKFQNVSQVSSLNLNISNGVRKLSAKAIIKFEKKDAWSYLTLIKENNKKFKGWKILSFSIKERLKRNMKQEVLELRIKSDKLIALLQSDKKSFISVFPKSKHTKLKMDLKKKRNFPGKIKNIKFKGIEEKLNGRKQIFVYTMNFEKKSVDIKISYKSEMDLFVLTGIRFKAVRKRGK